MVMNLDKCIGCHTCSVTCKQTWTTNHLSGKAEKCTLCFPRIEEGLPTICSETCVGRLRYLGLVLYDADKVLAAAATPRDEDLYEAQLSVFLDPSDPVVSMEAERQGIPHDWVLAARRSPTYALIARHRVALPRHPEYRTMPMVWYIPPLSPVADITAAAGYDETNPDGVFASIDALRIPVDYLANLFAAGQVQPVRNSLRRLAMIRAVMRANQLGQHPTVDPADVGQSEDDAEDLFRLLAIARYEDRYVVPPAHAGNAGRLLAQHTLSGCSLESEGGPGMGGTADEDDRDGRDPRAPPRPAGRP